MCACSWDEFVAENVPVHAAEGIGGSFKATGAKQIQEREAL
jgi:hypothetical protein